MENLEEMKTNAKNSRPPPDVNIENKENDGGGRGNWSTKWDYLLSAAGMAIGIGNVWRFPYLCYRNGGGAFLIPYLTMLLLVGIPVFFLETSMGQFASSGCVSLYSVCPAFKGIGYTSALTTLIASSYYGVVIAYPLVFLVQSFTYDLPWASCDNYWNTISCILPGSNYTINITDNIAVSAAEEFFENKILDKISSSGIEDPGSIVRPVLGATIFVWIFTFLCIFKGVNVLGKVVWFTATFPFVMLFILFIRGVTLPGAWIGIQYYLYPDFNKLLRLQVWSDAASQIIFSSGIGWGSLVTLGSFNKWKNNTVSDAMFVPILNCATSIFAGFVVFSVLGFMAHTTGVPIHSVTTGGPSLAFITYPQALSLMPLAPLWAVLFFAMLFFLGIDSLFVQTETIIVALTDEFPKLKHHKPWVTAGACSLILTLSISCCTQGGFYVLNLLDAYAVALPILSVCLGEVVVFALIYGGGRLVQDINIMTTERVSQYWWGMWVFVSPLLLIFMVLNTFMNNVNLMPDTALWVRCLGWMSGLIPLSAIPGYWLYYMVFKSKGDTLYKRMSSSHSPTSAWGPRLQADNVEWKNKRLLHPLSNSMAMPTYLKGKNFNKTLNLLETTMLNIDSLI